MSQPKKIINSLLNRNLNVNEFYDNDQSFYQGIYSQLNENNLIGKGVTGKVYLIEGGKYVVKEAGVCYSDEQVLIPYCNDLLKITNNPFIIIPSASNFRYILPNLLSEGIIGMIFKEKNMVSFSKIYMTMILFDKEIPTVYFVMPTYEPIINNKKVTPLTFLYLIFQVAYGLLQAQEKFLFTHYDLHLDNVLLEKSGDLKFDNISIPEKLCPFTIKISDYGLSRLQLDNILITPTISERPDAGFGEFNPSYDIICFMGSVLIDYRFVDRLKPLLQNLDLYNILIKFMLWLFNDTDIPFYSPNVISLIAEKYYRKVGNNYIFRPKVSEVNFVRFTNTKSMVEVVDYLSSILIKNNLATASNERKKYRVFDKILPFAPLIKQPNIPLYGDSSSNFIPMDIVPNYVSVASHRILFSSVPSDYNFTIDEKQLSMCPIQEHYMTAITVDPNIFGYEFSMGCCKLDPINFLRMNNFPGFTINGGFFNIGEKDFLPIGPYKDKNFISEKFEIPSLYRDVYGYVCMSKNKLYVTRDFKFAERQENMFSTGPFLIENGEIIFFPYEERFACNIKENVGNFLVSGNEKSITVSSYDKYEYSQFYNNCRRERVDKTKTFPRCDKIKPGELSHADNPNPRTCIIILKNGNYVFLTVEGRGSRGIGIDLYSLSVTIKKNFPNVLTAINLDGGRSTNMAWRTVNQPHVVYFSNPDHVYHYPVGNILVFGKV